MSSAINYIEGSPEHVRRNAKGVFFEAMRAGYAASVMKTSLPQLIGSKHIVYSSGEWTVTDTYIVTPLTRKGGGTTLIAYDDVPLWMMQYLGEYDPAAISFLKEALTHNYLENIFHGGRGPEAFYRNGWGYSNRVQGTFLEFSGEERVFDPTGKLMGGHRYQGLYLGE